MGAKIYDPDLWVKKFLEDVANLSNVFLERPSSFERGIHVEFIGGQAPQEALRSPAIMVETWGKTRAKALDAMTATLDAFTDAPGVALNGWLCVEATVLSEPYQTPDDDHPDISFYRCTVRLRLCEAIN